MNTSNFSVDFSWKQAEPPKRQYSASQVRLYRVFDRLTWGRGRLRPWTLRSAWHRLLMRTHYYDWRYQTMREQHITDAGKRLADKIDADILAKLTVINL